MPTVRAPAPPIKDTVGKMFDVTSYPVIFKIQHIGGGKRHRGRSRGLGF